MKKLLLLSLPLFFIATACTRQYVEPTQPVDEAYWLSQERGVVAESDLGCDYFVIETRDGYTVARSWGGYAPLRGSVVYGNLSQYGVHTFYNRSEGYLIQADVREYWLSYWGALDELNYSCSHP
jgi:hypothetical protein